MSLKNSDEMSAPETNVPQLPVPAQPQGFLMWVVVVFGLIVLLCGQLWGVRPGSKGIKAGGEQISQTNSDTQSHLPSGGQSSGVRNE